MPGGRRQGCPPFVINTVDTDHHAVPCCSFLSLHTQQKDAAALYQRQHRVSPCLPLRQTHDCRVIVQVTRVLILCRSICFSILSHSQLWQCALIGASCANDPCLHSCFRAVYLINLGLDRRHRTWAAPCYADASAPVSMCWCLYHDSDSAAKLAAPFPNGLELYHLLCFTCQ